MRLAWRKDEQIGFFRKVKEVSGLNRDELGKMVGIVGRSYTDWANGAILPSKDAVRILSDRFKVPAPEATEEREEWWSGRVNGRKGAIAKFKKYGCYGNLTHEDRVRGGKISQQRRIENPEYYRSLGCNVSNEFITPKKDKPLAEFVGIVLGDGCIARDQCQISLSYRDDEEFAKYVARLTSDLFGYIPSIVFDKECSVRKVVVSGIRFVGLLESIGLVVGDKVRQQVDIPRWIKQDTGCYRSCIRGLFDTDGGTFTHTHWCGGHRYRHFGLTFTSASAPLLDSYSFGLNCLGINHRKTKVNIFIDNLKDVEKFFKMVKPSNQKHWRRYQEHLSKSTRVG